MSHTNQPGAKKTSKAVRLVAVGCGTEFWLCGVEVYRVLTDGRPTNLDTDGLPMGRRWECASDHWMRYRDVFSWAQDQGGHHAPGLWDTLMQSALDGRWPFSASVSIHFHPWAPSPPYPGCISERRSRKGLDESVRPLQQSLRDRRQKPPAMTRCRRHG